LDQVLVGGYRTVMGLPHIADEKRREETRLWREFARERSEIFGALLDVVAHGLKHIAHVRVPDLPRLADLALWGTAIEGAYATTGAFIAAFNSSQAIATDATVEVNPVATAVAAFMEDRASAWDGTTTQLWRELQQHDQAEARPTETKDWPRNPVAFGIALAKTTQTLRKIGIVVERDRSTSRRRTPMVHLRGIEPEADTGAETSEGSEGSETRSHLQRESRAVAKIVPFRG